MTARPGGSARAAAAAPRVLVVGAGFSGLAAAHRLHALGFEVEVVERSDTPGGRAVAVRVHGHELDPAGHLLWSSDRGLRALLSATGVGEALRPWPTDALRRTVGGGTEALRTGRPGPRRRPRGLGWRAAWRLARLDRLGARYRHVLDAAAPEAGARLDDRSAAEWASLYFGSDALSAWLSPLAASATLGDDAETSRLLPLLLGAATRGAAPASLPAGPAPVARALADRLGARFGVRVESLSPLRGGFVADVQAPGGDARLEADAVVLAVPAGEAARIGEFALTEAEQGVLRAVAYRPAVALAVLAQGDVDLPWRRLVVTRGTRSLRSLQLGAGVPGPSRPLAGLSLVGAVPAATRIEEEDDQAWRRRLLDEAEPLAPHLVRDAEGGALRRHAQALPRFGVGHARALARLRGVEARRLGEGRALVHAGDHLVAPRLEGAVQSGLRAADALARHFGLARDPATP